MSEQIEGAGEVREEDAFDLEAVRSWLGEQGTTLDGPVEVQQFGGGASNLTYSLRTPDARPDPAAPAERAQGQGRARHGS